MKSVENNRAYLQDWFSCLNNVHIAPCCSTAQSHQLFVTPWTATCQVSLSFTISQPLLTFMSIEWVTSSSHLILCCLLLLLPSLFPSIRAFSSELDLHIRWPKYWSFSFRISPSNEYSGLIPFRMDWSDLLAVQGTLKSLQCPVNSEVCGFRTLAVQDTLLCVNTLCRSPLAPTCPRKQLSLASSLVSSLLHPRRWLKCQEMVDFWLMFGVWVNEQMNEC